MAGTVETTHIRARTVFSGPRGLLRDVGIRIENGRVVAVGPASEVRPAAGDERVDFEGLLTPGLVNGHTHLELSRVGRPPPMPFDQWVIAVARLGPMDGPGAAAATLEAAALAVAEGTSLVGDITTWPAATRDALGTTPLGGVSFGEVRGMGARKGLWPGRLAAAVDFKTSARMRGGISPHSPYSLERAGFRACVAEAKARNLRLCCHIAEHADEGEFLSAHTGMLSRLWDTLGGWDVNEPVFAGSPVRFADAVGLLSGCSLMAHVNYASDADLDLIAAKGGHVAFCPRTHAYFGHPPHRYREMLARGINVCLGTDSAASGGDVSILREARFLFGTGDIDAGTIWDMLTWRGADALGDALSGRVVPGSPGDFCFFPRATGDESPDILASVLSGSGPPMRSLA